MKELYLKAKHFKGTNYSNNLDCAIVKAAKEQVRQGHWTEGVSKLTLLEIHNDICFRHEPYSDADFIRDKLQAVKVGYDDTIIRTIELIPETVE